jgi:glycosyltransferase involved in cell wall biosynthesis
MKVLFDHPSPFCLAHGGLQIQIERTKAALDSIGVPVEYLRWWDEAQGGDIIHYFGRPPVSYVQLAQQKKRKIVIAELLGGLGARRAPARAVQRLLIGLARGLLPSEFYARMAWESYEMAEACVALSAWEAHLMRVMFSAPRSRVHVVPNGVEEVFLNSPPSARGPWLVCTATITEVKRVAELAQAAVTAQTPVWIIGKSYSDNNAYAQQFYGLAKRHPQFVRHEGPLNDRSALASVYRQARGFVLLSRWESLSLSALEAAACGCALLLSDLPWARSVFGEQVQYCPIASIPHTARILRQFYAAAPTLKPPSRPLSWSEVAQRLKTIYEQVLSTSR